jgi:hypothetical protein
MNAVASITYAAAVLFWVVTGTYALLASREFIVEQFLRPELFAPLAVFARYWSVFAAAGLGLWAAARASLIRQRDLAVSVTAGAWLFAVVAWLGGAAPLGAFGVPPLWWSLAAIAMIWLSAASEYPVISGAAARATTRTAADLLACVLAAGLMVAIDLAVAAARGTADPAGDVQVALRTQILAGMVAFLALTVVRGVAGVSRRPVVMEARLAIALVGIVIGAFLHRVALPSISLAGLGAAAGAYLAGYALAVAVSAPALIRFEDKSDGVANVAGGFAPSLASRWPGAGAWFTILAVLAVQIDRATQAADWNFVAARAGVLAIGLGVLGGAIRVVRTNRQGSPWLLLSVPALVLAAHTAADLRAGRAAPLEATTPASRWAADVLSPATTGPSSLYRLLTANTNLTAAAQARPVDVNWSPLESGPAAVRPHIFMFVIDSLRRDYLSPYNPQAAFSPHIGAFAADSVVFDRAFTQYGATGLSIPSIWIGGALLHQQYVTPFAPMNALAKLLAHEQYAQWISMDNILDVILPPTPALDRLDRGIPVKDFRMCRTLDEIRARLRARAPGAPPIFAYSLPQDLHISVITREGGAIDQDAYPGFYAPVASRIKRFDACFGDFVAELKSAGLYESSIIILTSDHGDSLGEGGRMGHAYSLSPEIVRVPLIVRVPDALRRQYQWDSSRPSYTTDLTPTLYQLLGHAPQPPGAFYGESLARPPGAPVPPARDRMIAASYGSVYGALMRDAAAMYVVNAIERREHAFAIGAGAAPGSETPLDAATRRAGGDLIRATVEAIGRAYNVAQSK